MEICEWNTLIETMMLSRYSKKCRILILFCLICGICMCTYSTSSVLIDSIYHFDMTRFAWNGAKNTSILSTYRKSSSNSDLVNMNSSSNFKVSAINCAALFQGSKLEQNRADIYHLQTLHSKQSWKGTISNCTEYIEMFGYVMKPVSEEEAEFSIAYSIVMYRDSQQVERLLRAIYRPQNYYCIHVDKESPVEIHQHMSTVSKCFPNVFIASELQSVTWGAFTVLNSELVCMKDLLKYDKWRYFINLTGQEFPLKTNWEIVRILKIFDGANSITGVRNEKKSKRWRHLEGKTPGNVTLFTGPVHIVASRGFVNFSLHHPIAVRLQDMMKYITIPDEVFFNTLNNNPQIGAPGAYTGEVPFSQQVSRFKIWMNLKKKHECHGKIIRNICIFGVRDLPNFLKRTELFVNKLFWDYEPLTYQCLEELHHNRSKEERLGPRWIDVDFYRSLPFVKHHN